jgi:AcrR family transcriptional regulator
MKAMSKSEQHPAPVAEAIPPVLQLAWGRRDAGSRGPKRGLTLERIVAAGINVAHTDGVGALSMARIAGELGVGTMSLYRYVAAKDELLNLMVDTALGAPPPPAPGEDWRAGLRRWALGVWEAYRRQPWVLRVPISGPPYGPNNVAWLDNGLAALAETPLCEADKASTVLLLSGFVRNVATLSADFAAGSAGSAGSAGEAVMPGYGAVLTQLTTAEQFPALHRAIASGVFDDDDEIEVELEFGLERILDGVAVLIERTGPSRKERPR